MTDRTVRVRVVAELPGVAAAVSGAASSLVLLGEAAGEAGVGMTALGVDATEARTGLTGLAAGARGGAAAVGEAEAAAVSAGAGMRAAGVEAEAARGPMGRLGAAAESGLGTVRSAAAGALETMTHLGTLLAGGAILFGLHDIVHQGNEYNDAMQKFSEVTRATGLQMSAAGSEAQALGADMKLPSASAAEAADAMVELAKAGLSAEDAVKAARGTIQLAAAARTDVATAAKIEGDVMDEFALKATDAAHVADILANTSNSASGELMDIYYAMKYVGPTAKAMGISLQDVATAVGLLGKSGIIGDTAGTSLRGALVNLAKPTHQMADGLHTLGIEAFDSAGNFKGLQYVITQLHTAQEHLTVQQFTAAAAMAFGKPALSAMTALAHQGGDAFEQFSIQVGRAGGAANLAAAESKGLGGAMRTLGKEITSTFLQVYLGIAPALESITRSMTSSISDAIPYVKKGIKDATDLWEIYGPAVESKLSAAGAVISAEARQLAGTVGKELGGIAKDSLPLLERGLSDLGRAWGDAEKGATPVIDGLEKVYKSATSTGGAIDILTGRVKVGAGIIAGSVDGLSGATAILGPLGQLLGGVLSAFSELPGWVQLSAISMVALRPFRGQFQQMQDSIVGFGRAGIDAFRGIGDASLYQRVQAANAGITLGRFGGLMADLEQRVPVIGRMADSFRTTSGSIEEAGGRLVGFRSTVGGVTAAIGTGAGAGLAGAFRGLLGFLGGPWGVAITGAMIGLDALAKGQQKAAAAAAAHEARISSLTQALEQSNGHIDAAVRSTAVQTLMDAKLKDGKTALLDVMHRAGISTVELTDAYLGQAGTIDELRAKLLAAAGAGDTLSKDATKQQLAAAFQSMAYKDAADALTGLSGEASASSAKYKDLTSALKGGAGAAQAATDPTGRLQKVIDTLGSSESDADTKARALHEALTLLSGGELDVAAAVAQKNQAMLQLNGSYTDGVDQAKGYGKALLQVDGSLNTTNENGQALWNNLQALNTQTAAAASAAYDYARANGTAVVPALKLAESQMQDAWEAAVTAGQKFGLTADEAKNLAAQMGFIPSNLAIALSTPGLDDTTKDLLYVQGLADRLAPGATVKVSALTDEAVKDLQAVGITVNTLPGGRQMEITAPTDAAIKSIDDLINKKIPEKTATVVTDNQGALAGLQIVKETLAALPGVHSITVQALTGDATAALNRIGFATETLPDGRVKVTVPTDPAFNSVNSIQSSIDNIRGKSVNVHVTTDYTTVGSGPYAGKPQPNANGGIYAYANGGVTAAADGLNTRQAMVSNRAILWAEAGPEAYIPLSPSKRARSTALLGTVAQGFGYQLVPIGQLSSPASGGTTYDQRRTAEIHLHGARQTSAEQLADVQRHLAFYG